LSYAEVSIIYFSENITVK